MMKRFLPALLVLGFLGAGALQGEEEKKADDPYAELFTVPAKIVLDDEQKEKLAELRKENETVLATFDKSLKQGNSPALYDLRGKLYRVVTRKKNAILTDEQRKTLGIKTEIPSFALEKALNDPAVWDVNQLERLFTIQSRSYDPIEAQIAFMVITKRKWTEQEKQIDAMNWATTFAPKIKAVFYTKDDETSFTLSCPFQLRDRGYTQINGGITRVATKLTEKEEEEGLLRFRIKIDLDYSSARGVGLGAGLKLREAATVKFLYPEPKQ